MSGEGEEKKIRSFLGLCMRAGGLVSGETAVVGTIRSGKAYLVLVAHDASENTAKMYGDKCASYGTDMMFFGTAEAIGEAIGKNRRTAVAVTEENFARELKKRLALLNKEL